MTEQPEPVPAAGTPGPPAGRHISALAGRALALADEADSLRRPSGGDAPRSGFEDREPTAGERTAGSITGSAYAAAGLLRERNAKQAIRALRAAYRSAFALPWADWIDKLGALIAAAEDARAADLPPGCAVSADRAAGCAMNLRGLIGNRFDIHDAEIGPFLRAPDAVAAVASLNRASVLFEEGRERDGTRALEEAVQHIGRSLDNVRPAVTDPGALSGPAAVAREFEHHAAAVRRVRDAAVIMQEENARAARPGLFAVRVDGPEGFSVYTVTPGSRGRAALVADAVREGSHRGTRRGMEPGPVARRSAGAPRLRSGRRLGGIVGAAPRQRDRHGTQPGHRAACQPHLGSR